MQDAVDQALIHPLVDNVFCKPVGRFDEQEIVGFIKIILVLEKRDLQSIFCR